MSKTDLIIKNETYYYKKLNNTTKKFWGSGNYSRYFLFRGGLLTQPPPNSRGDCTSR